jgi:hypothetical protein
VECGGVGLGANDDVVIAAAVISGMGYLCQFLRLRSQIVEIDFLIHIPQRGV